MPPRRQRILITGASSGLGAELARIWAADGRDLALCARRLPELQALCEELHRAHPGQRFFGYRLDVTDAAAVRTVFDRARDDLGGLDRVIANAGIGLGEHIGSGGADVNRAVLQTNVIGTMNTVEQAVYEFWQRQAGHVVIISSVAALRGLGGRRAAYSMSKAAVATLGESLRNSLWHRPIAVTTVFPGYIDTAINADDPHKLWSTDLQTGARELARAIDAEPAKAYVPKRPWSLLAPVIKVAPLRIMRRISG